MLKERDLVGEGGVRDIEFLGGGGKMKVGGEWDKVLELV